MDTSYLLFQLYGPMASWGEIAVGENRHSAMRPSKSAIIGLLAAGLGVKRDQQKELDELYENLWVSSKVLAPGFFLEDYHTAQVPGEARKVIHPTRKSELTRQPRHTLKTQLSRREYRCDALWLIAIHTKQNSTGPALDLLKQALLRPVFQLFLGRKSCPLALPMAPTIIAAPGVKSAFDQFHREQIAKEPDLYRLLSKDYTSQYYWEHFDGELTAHQTLHRFDHPGNRRRWQFTERTEKVMSGEKL